MALNTHNRICKIRFLYKKTVTKANKEIIAASAKSPQNGYTSSDCSPSNEYLSHQK